MAVEMMGEADVVSVHEVFVAAVAAGVAGAHAVHHSNLRRLPVISTDF